MAEKLLIYWYLYAPPHFSISENNLKKGIYPVSSKWNKAVSEKNNCSRAENLCPNLTRVRPGQVLV